MTAPQGTLASCDFAFCPEDILALCNGAIGVNAPENGSTTTDLAVVYNHKPPEIRNAIVVVDDQSSAGLDCKSADLVALQLFASVTLALERRRIHYPLD